MKALILVFLLAGCNGTFSGVCAVKGIGQNESGISFAMVQCEPYTEKK